MEIADLKMCWFCRESEEWPYTESSVKMHEMFGLHSTLGKTWAPTKGHKDFLSHEKWLALLT